MIGYGLSELSLNGIWDVNKSVYVLGRNQVMWMCTAGQLLTEPSVLSLLFNVGSDTHPVYPLSSLVPTGLESEVSYGVPSYVHGILSGTESPSSRNTTFCVTKMCTRCDPPCVKKRLGTNERKTSI